MRHASPVFSALKPLPCRETSRRWSGRPPWGFAPHMEIVSTAFWFMPFKGVSRWPCVIMYNIIYIYIYIYTVCIYIYTVCIYIIYIYYIYIYMCVFFPIHVHWYALVWTWISFQGTLATDRFPLKDLPFWAPLRSRTLPKSSRYSSLISPSTVDISNGRLSSFRILWESWIHQRESSTQSGKIRRAIYPGPIKSPTNLS